MESRRRNRWKADPLLKIVHRVNTIKALESVPSEFGVEMDLHAYGERLIVHHDAFSDGVDFSDWLEAFNHSLVILNIKEEGIEGRALEMVLKRGISEFFMLDLSFPALFKLVQNGERRVALRVSEYEPVVGALTLSGKAEWVWLDVFHGLPVSRGDLELLREAGYKICLVSPELHGRSTDEIEDVKRRMSHLGLVVEAVCTKRPDLW